MVYRLLLIFIILFLRSNYSYSQDFSEPDFIFDGIVFQSNEGTSFTAFAAHLDKYLDWKHNQENAIRIKEKGKEGSTVIKKNIPLKVVIKLGDNSVSPSQIFSIISFKQKKNERVIDFIGYIPRQTTISTSTSSSRNVNGTNQTLSTSATTFTALPTYEDRFPESVVRISGKKLGNESYILNIPALNSGEYALCFKNQNNEIMIVDLSVK